MTGSGGAARDQLLDTRGAAHGAETPWESMSIEEILAKIATMSGSSAFGDANAVLVAAQKAHDVAASLIGTFGADTLRGLSARESLLATTSIAEDIETSAAVATELGTAIAAASGVLGLTAAQVPVLTELHQRLRENPEQAPAVRSTISSLMSNAYSSPMVSLAGSLPEPTGVIKSDQIHGPSSVTGSGALNSAAGPADGGRTQSGAVADIEVGKSTTETPGGVPTEPGPTAPDSGGEPPRNTTPTSPTSPDGPATKPNGDDPDTLTRGGLATPLGAGTPASGVPGHGARASGGGQLGGVGSSLGSPSATTDFPLQLFTSGAAPTTGSLGAGTPATPVGRPVSGPMAPPGARPRDPDTRHRSAPYLHHGDNGREIVGDLPLVGPPVLGDWALRAGVAAGGGAAETTPSLPVVDQSQPGGISSATPDMDSTDRIESDRGDDGAEVDRLVRFVSRDADSAGTEGAGHRDV